MTMRKEEPGEPSIGGGERSYRLIVENAAEGIWTIDDTGVTTYVNGAMADLLGYERHEMIGRPMYEFMDEVARQEARANMDRRRTGLRERHPFRLRHKSGHTVWTSMATSPLHDESGRFIGALAMVNDERAHAQATEQQNLREQQLVALDKMTSLSALVAGVIHEINNPNHFITLNASLLKRVCSELFELLESQQPVATDTTLAGIPYTEMRAEVPRMLEQILLGAERIRHIVGELRAYVNSDTAPVFRPIAINDVVASAVTLLEGRIRRSTDRFTQNLGQGLPAVLADASRLLQVVVNVLLNALESLTNDTREVELVSQVDTAAGIVELIVRDTGAGIDAETLSKIRTPFFTTKRARGGLGLGLAVADRILAEHRAELVLASQPGAGTEARLRLPIAG